LDCARTGFQVADRHAEPQRHVGDWLESRGATPEEIVGCHFEQAIRFGKQLGPHDTHALGSRNAAGEKLASAAIRAFARALRHSAAVCSIAAQRWRHVLGVHSGESETDHPRRKATYDDGTRRLPEDAAYRR
jgi:hypothetical protein